MVESTPDTLLRIIPYSTSVEKYDVASAVMTINSSPFDPLEVSSLHDGSHHFRIRNVLLAAVAFNCKGFGFRIDSKWLRKIVGRC
jgi:hypothetical protein